MAISLVQHNYGPEFNQTGSYSYWSQSVAYSSPNSAGGFKNLLIAYVSYMGAEFVGGSWIPPYASVTDTAGNTWTYLYSGTKPGINGLGVAAFFCLNAAASSNTVTVTLGGGIITNTFIGRVFIEEYQADFQSQTWGYDPIVVYNYVSGVYPDGGPLGAGYITVSGTGSNSGGYTGGVYPVTTLNGDLIVSVAASFNVTPAFAAGNVPTGTTLVTTQSGTHFSMASQWGVQPSAGSIASNIYALSSTGADVFIISGSFHATYATPVPSLVFDNLGPTAGGTPVYITGTNLLGATGVTFGGIAASSVTTISDTKITCTTGAHTTGLVNVVVSNPDNSGTIVNGYTYQDSFIPRWVSV